MFARHTHTRMKGSSVVQGLKEWASRLHPQLPLSSKESNRLLTALTSSFRQHLDEVHPPTAAEDSKHKPGKGGVSKTNAHAMHSSAKFADKHLASVLMNPLLTKGSGGVKKADQDFANAQVELQKDPAKDPIILLEEYHRKGAATVPIARLCLEVSAKSLEGLSEDAQQKAIIECDAGRRTLLWLWKSEQYKQAAFVEDRHFVDLLVAALMRAGHEEYIWEWIKLDQALADEEPDFKLSKRMYHRYRWKGRLLASIVSVNLRSPHWERQSADAALVSYLRACKLKAASSEGSHMRFLPLGPAGLLLCNAFHKGPHWYRNTNPRLFESFMVTVQHAFGGLSLELEKASLWLDHPTNPTAQPLYKYYKSIVERSSLPSRWHMGQAMRNDDPVEEEDSPVHSYHRLLMTEAMCLLRDEGCSAEAAWMEERITRLFPRMANKHLKSDILKFRAKRIGNLKNETRKVAVDERIPLPTFAWS